MNRGGFSWKRLIGLSALKAKISRTIGVPLTKSGRERKLGALIIKSLRSLLLEYKKSKP
ncbi:Uncharacterised protein [Legionella wadsworthii]|uniref:Uncharacterized protein n=1 Tax=Legionella wadsworthii TaxID=28088 RepID=A0A378LM33_9GAMM|nr:Uncharacterised protein [Legionella wadsworthii]